MASIGTNEAFQALKRRVERLELWKRRISKQMANEVQDLKDLKAAVDAHNAADAQYQTDSNKKIADLEAAVAANDPAAIDAAIQDLKDSVAAQPVLTLPA